MLYIKTRFSLICAVLLCLCGCHSTKYDYICPFGVGYLTKMDYETIQDGNLISDSFVEWLLATNTYCEEVENDKSN